MNFLDWLFGASPPKKKDFDEEGYLADLNSEEETEEENTTNFPEYKGESKNTFRPQKFSEYIGQRKGKDIIKNYLKGTKDRERIFPHTLISGSAGYGKTTLANIIAKELKKVFIETITSNIENFDELKTLIIKTDGGILFLDEIHSLERNSAEKLYTIMEDFKFQGKPIKPFTIIGATTELGEIIKNRKPFYDRFKIILELQDYKVTDLSKILTQYKKRVFPDDKLKRNVYKVIASNCRYTPRTAIRLLEACIYFNGNIKAVLDSFNIIRDGITAKDIKLLNYIRKNDKGIGLQTIVSYLNTSPDNYLYEVEPFLLKRGLILRTNRGRMITEEAIQLLKELINE